MTLETYLLVTGIGAFIALAFPALVMIGLFLGIIPGFILGLMPTAFLYGLVFAACRFALAFVLTGAPLDIAAAAGTLAVMWAIPQPVARAALAELAAMRDPDVLPPTPIALFGHIRISGAYKGKCDELCAALLKTPGVESVGLGTDAEDVLTYRLVDIDAPGESQTATGFGMAPKAKYDASDPLKGLRGLETEWNLMLTTRRLKLVASRESIAPDFSILSTNGPTFTPDPRRRRSDAWSLAASIPHKQALEILDRDGKALLRQSILSTYVPSAPLFVGSDGGIENFRLRWERKRLGDGSETSEIPKDALILEHTTIARGVDEAALGRQMRSELEAALADPARDADDAAFKLANQWMEGQRIIAAPFDAGERRLLAQILADRRVTHHDGLWAAVKRLDDPALDLRKLGAKRYLDAQQRKEARSWVNAFSALPDGAFATLLAEEREILAAPGTSMYATGLIARLGDRGVAAMPDLLRLLREYATYDPGPYRFGDLTSSAGAVCKGFRAIGPDAAPALGEIEALLATPGLARHYGNQREDWDVLRVVLGRPVDTLEKPENNSLSVERYRLRIAERAAKPFDRRARN